MVVLMIFSVGACGTEESQNAGQPEDTENGSAKQKSQMEGYLRPVSYTHLTLPTNSLV